MAKHSKENDNKKGKRIKNKVDKEETKIYKSKTKIEDEVKENIDDTKDNKLMKKEMKKKKNGKHKVLKRILKLILALILIAIIAVIAIVYAIFKTDKWAITKEELLNDQGATIYNADGSELIATLTGDEINKKVELSQMGKIPDAFISIEDERFYSHHGIDLKRTIHAIAEYILHGGKSSFGGSTITQQLVKITMNDNDNSWKRKIREWSRAYKVEKMLTKDQILQRYLNRIYLGSSNGLEIRGVESAANYYFNKSAADLSIAECAFIAGINHSPNNYNVFTSETDISTKVKERTLNVIGKMHELGKITDEEYNTAVEEVNNGLKFEKGEVTNGKSSLSYHTAAAINEIATDLAEKNDISYDEAREQLINNGYKIYTTVNTSIQSKMEEVFSNKKYIYTGTKPKNASEDHSGQSGMCVIDPSNGFVVGEVGGLGDQNTLELNRGLVKRQGGSSFKPLVTIAPGLENKVITASTLFYDTETKFGNYTVHNDSNSYHGVENMRNILTHSCNVPEVKILSIMGTQKSADFLSKIGINVNASETGLSMALGTVDVSPLQMAAGYAMIANGGTYITPTFYTKVLDRDDKVIVESKQETTQVMSKENAYIEASLLEGPIKNGTASSFANYLGNMDVAGKTGTTETAGDRWFCGFTPYYAAACWYGNDNNNGQFHNSACGGANPAGTIWFNCMKKIHQDLEVKSFEQPDGIVSVTICKDSGRKATSKCTNTYTEIFSKDNIPSECEGHDTIKICKETGKLATDYCPDVEEKSSLIIDTEKNATWSPNLKDDIPTEKCDVHTEAQKESVPNVVGLNKDAAEKKLKDAGFSVVTKLDSDTTKAKDIVLRQSETSASKGATITITINGYDGKKNTNTISNTSKENNNIAQNKTNTNTSTNTNTETKNNSTTKANSTSETSDDDAE